MQMMMVKMMMNVNIIFMFSASTGVWLQFWSQWWHANDDCDNDDDDDDDNDDDNNDEGCKHNLLGVSSRDWLGFWSQWWNENDDGEDVDECKHNLHDKCFNWSLIVILITMMAC